MNFSTYLTIGLSLGLAISVIIGAVTGNWLFWIWMGLGVGAAVGNAMGYLNRTQGAAYDRLSRRKQIAD